MVMLLQVLIAFNVPMVCATEPFSIKSEVEGIDICEELVPLKEPPKTEALADIKLTEL